MAFRAFTRHAHLSVQTSLFGPVARQTEVTHGFGKQSPVGGGVRLVAIAAKAFLYRRVDELPFERIVTEEA